MTSGAKAAVDLVLEEVNSRNDILPNYTLSYSTIRDSEVSKMHVHIVYVIFAFVHIQCKEDASVKVFVQEFTVPYLS